MRPSHLAEELAAEHQEWLNDKDAQLEYFEYCNAMDEMQTESLREAAARSTGGKMKAKNETH